MLSNRQNRSSSRGASVAVRNTSCARIRTKIWPSCNIFGRNCGPQSKMLWLSSNTTRSSLHVACARLTNVANPLLTAASGVTKMIDRTCAG